VCSPTSLTALRSVTAAAEPRLALTPGGLDALAEQVCRGAATPATTAAFHAALLKWTRARLRQIAPWLQRADVDDLAHDFWLRCMTRHLPAWDPTACVATAYLYRRLHCETVDELRRHQRRARVDDVDDVEVAAPAVDVVDLEAAREREQKIARLDAAVERLPRRQRAVLRRTLRGEPLAAVAKDVRIHHTTASRERALAIATVQRALAA
jgi:RNA polymerase sigma factor (sigma-70 family)